MRPDEDDTVARRREPTPAWSDFFGLLRETEPIADAYDVEWWGPYVIPRPRRWHRTRFLLYGGSLFGSIEVEWSVYSAQWDIASGIVSYERAAGFSAVFAPEDLWARAIRQLAHRLKAALSNPAAYNDRIRRLIPLDARTGRIVRKRTWPRGMRPLLSRADLARLEAACRRGEGTPSVPEFRAADWFRLVGRLYDAAFPELAGRPPREQHASKADTRHGGLLDLPEDDPRAFREWHESRRWSGCHPWEIVFGHPHGILFAPVPDEAGAWRLGLSVDSEGLYVEAAKMAVALGDEGVPFTLHGKDAVAAALRGTDEVEVGPSWGRLLLAELRETRPESVEHVRWDPIPEIRPISDPQRRKVEHVLRHGSPAGQDGPP